MINTRRKSGLTAFYPYFIFDTSGAMKMQVEFYISFTVFTKWDQFFNFKMQGYSVDENFSALAKELICLILKPVKNSCVSNFWSIILDMHVWYIRTL